MSGTTSAASTLTVDNREMIEMAARDIAKRANKIACLCTHGEDANHEQIADEAYKVRELAERMEDIAIRDLP